MLSRVNTGLLVGASNDGVLGLLVGDKGRDQLQLEALSNVVLELDVVPQHVRRGPSLGQGGAASLVGPLGLEFTVDLVRLGVARSQDSEADIVGGFRLDLKGRSVDWATRGRVKEFGVVSRSKSRQHNCSSTSTLADARKHYSLVLSQEIVGKLAKILPTRRNLLRGGRHDQ